MGFSFDINNKLKQSKMILANPQKKYVGMISGAENVKLTLKFNSLNELSFTIYECKNNEFTEFYDKIVKMRLIELQYIGWFQIQNVVEKSDDKSKESYKEVKCYSLENELIYKKVFDISGVFSLYDVSNTSKSLLHIVADASGYNIGHIDNSLLGKYRTFDIESEQVYSLLTTTVSKSFSCVFTFDTYTRTINCYELANMGELTDIVVSKKNILKDHIKDDGDSSIITKLRVYGGDGVDIRAVNVGGTNYIINLDYFMSEDWGFSQSTIDAWNNYKLKTEQVSASYSTTLSLLKTKQSELLVLNTQLTDLQSLLQAQESVKGDCMDFFNPRRVPYSSDSNYTIYQNAINLISVYTTQIANKKIEIASKESEITTVNSTLNSISTALDWNTNFTPEQIADLNIFLSEDQDYSDGTFTVNSVMSESEIIDMKLELLHNAYNELIRASQPQFTYTTNSNNLFTICDNKDELISYSKWREKFLVGNLITVKFRRDYSVTVRLMEMTIDFDNPEEIELVFSDKSRLDDALIQLGEVISTAGKAATSYSLSKLGYDNASSITNEVRKFINGSLNATTNRVFSDSHVQTELSQYGIINRKWLDDQKKYDDRQSLLTQNVMLFTDDGWKSSRTGIGYFTSASGETYYGVLGEIVCGQLLLGENLTIKNASGTYTIDKNGFTAVNGIYSVGINPNTPSEIINISVNGSRQLYIDTVNKKLVYKGNLEAVGGTFSGSLNAATGTFAGNLSACGGTFSGTLQGVDGTFSGSLSAATGTFSGTLNASTIIGGTIKGTEISGVTISGENTISANTFHSYGMGGYADVTEISGGSINCKYLEASQSVSCNNLWCTTINDKTPSYSGHMHTTYDITVETTTNGNINFYGAPDGASVTWCNDTFEPKSSSDFRLKKDIIDLDLPDNIFMNFKPKQFLYKCDEYHKNKVFGLLSQQVIKAFEDNDLNPWEYDLIDKVPVRHYTDEGLYVNDSILRLNYNNLITWTIYMVQKLYKRIEELEKNNG